MKIIFSTTIFFCVALLPQIIHGDHSATQNLLDEIAERDGNIDNIFKPSKNGWLGEGMAGLTYRGVLIEMGIEVAMKFISDAYENYATNEHKAYIALGAVNNTDTELYGIPTLYHFGQWRNYYMIAITLLDSEFAQVKDNKQLNIVDILIVFRELVRTTKYLHSHNICHGDPHLNNIMFRQHQGFLIDYNMAVEAPKNSAAGIACAKKDWRKFLADMAYLFNIKVVWDSERNPIKKFKSIQPDGLKRVFYEFIMTTYTEPVLNYNEIYNIINEEISRYDTQGSAIVSWLTGDRWTEAYFDLSLNQIPPIESIE